MFKNNAESPLFELSRDVFSKNVQSSMPLRCFSCSFHFANSVSPVVSSFRYMACANLASVKQLLRRSRRRREQTLICPLSSLARPARSGDSGTILNTPRAGF